MKSSKLRDPSGDGACYHLQWRAWKAAVLSHARRLTSSNELTDVCTLSGLERSGMSKHNTTSHVNIIRVSAMKLPSATRFINEKQDAGDEHTSPGIQGSVHKAKKFMLVKGK